MHSEWKDKLMEADFYMMDYVLSSSISDEDAADLYQILQATRFISSDFSDFTAYSDFYEAMHSEEHEMVERVKFRLATEY